MIENFGLRFDLTVPAARMFIEKQKQLPKPVKWFYLSRMWRYEAPQKGRLREFYQFSAEVFGSNKPEADAEIISLAIDALKSTGLTEKDFFVKINNRKLLEGLLLDVIDKDKMPDAMRVIDKRTKITEQEFNEELKKDASLMNNDPYGAGWIAIIEPKDLDGDLKEEFVFGEAELKTWMEKEIAEHVK